MASVRRYELFVPMEYNADADGHREPIEPEKYIEIETALFQAFGGLTKSNPNTPFHGYWVSPESGLMNDRIVIYTMLDFSWDFFDGEQVMRDLKARLIVTLEQEEILLLYSNLSTI